MIWTLTVGKMILILADIGSSMGMLVRLSVIGAVEIFSLTLSLLSRAIYAPRAKMQNKFKIAFQ